MIALRNETNARTQPILNPEQQKKWEPLRQRTRQRVNGGMKERKR